MDNIQTLPRSVLKTMCMDPSKLGKTRGEYLEQLSMEGVYEIPMHLTDPTQHVENNHVENNIHLTTNRDTTVQYAETDTSIDFENYKATDATYTDAFVSRDLISNEIRVNNQSLIQSLDTSTTDVDSMSSWIDTLNHNMISFRFDLSQQMYNNQFLLEVDPRINSWFKRHLHPGLALGKGFGILENETNWSDLYLDFKIVVPTVDEMVQIDHIEISSPYYTLNGFWVNQHPRFIVSDTKTVGDSVFTLVIPLEHSEDLQITIYHVSDEFTPVYETIVNDRVAIACTTTTNTTRFVMPTVSSNEVFQETTNVHGDCVEWTCRLQFDATQIGYNFDFERVKLKLPYRMNTFNTYKYYPVKSIMKYTTLSNATPIVIHGTSYIDSEYLFVEKTRLESLSLLDIELFAKYPYVPEEVPMFTSMRYDVLNNVRFVSSDVIHASTFVFSNGDMHWMYFNNRINVTCVMNLWHIDVLTEDTDTIRFKLPFSASFNVTQNYVGKCVITIDGKLATSSPIVDIQTNDPEYLSIRFLKRILTNYTLPKLIGFKVHIEYVFDMNELVRTSPTLTWNANASHRLQFSNVTFRNSVDMNDVPSIEDNHSIVVDLQRSNSMPVEFETLTRSFGSHANEFRNAFYSSTRWTLNATSIRYQSFIHDVEINERSCLKKSSAYNKRIIMTSVIPIVNQVSRPKPYIVTQRASEIRLNIRPKYQYLVRSVALRKQTVPLKHLIRTKNVNQLRLALKVDSYGPIFMRIEAKKYSFQILR